ncbi:hypothetical protein EX30DRAFT_46103 [Ascodesmis nigricans]|uniref:Uncharacterized protein n=1 Tax=Ascodesmis nigricans TaxID=341454 RepID=A0A4S2MVT6_9PEZI|nr:hypothetical protein EX30DRAFT_46103 [Ascodesmis nigricans]
MPVLAPAPVIADSDAPPPHPLRSRSRRHAVTKPKPAPSAMSSDHVPVRNETKSPLFIAPSPSSSLDSLHTADHGPSLESLFSGAPLSLPPTPPPLSVLAPITPERKKLVEVSADSNKADGSPRRGLRRIRGSISEGSRRTSDASDGLDEGVPVVHQRRLSLHHPRPLRSSPKSAYLEDERKGAEAAATDRSTSLRAQLVSIPVVVKTENIPPRLVTVHRPSDRAKERIINKSGQKITPWATRQNSVATSLETSSVGSQAPSSELDTSDANSSGSSSPGDSITENVPTRRRPVPPQFLISCKPETTTPRPHTTTRTSSSSTKRPAPKPIADPPVEPSQPTSLSRRTTDPGHRPSSCSSRPPNPRRTSSTRRAPVVIQALTPAKPTLPAVNLIPATPLALTTSAEQEKQLGIPGTITRRTTGISIINTPCPIPEDQVPPGLVTLEGADGGDTARAGERPSIADVDAEIRESKLHPWWQPKAWRGYDHDDYDNEERRELGILDEEGVERNGGTRRRKRGIKPGRKQVQIRGTKLVVEYMTWKAIGEMFKLKKMPKRVKAGDGEQGGLRRAVTA